MSMTDQLKGTSWRLVEYQSESKDGDVLYPLGEDTLGTIIFTEAGHTAVQIMAKDRSQPLSDEKLEKYIYSILVAGILGNLIDRIFRRHVIDYLDFRLFGYDMAIFNFADICIVVSCSLLLLLEVIKWKKSQLVKQTKD